MLLIMKWLKSLNSIYIELVDVLDIKIKVLVLQYVKNNKQNN